MIGNTIYDDQFLPFLLNDACNNPIEVFFPTGLNQGLPAFDGKNDLDVHL